MPASNADKEEREKHVLELLPRYAEEDCIKVKTHMIDSLVQHFEEKGHPTGDRHLRDNIRNNFGEKHKLLLKLIVENPNKTMAEIVKKFVPRNLQISDATMRGLSDYASRLRRKLKGLEKMNTEVSVTLREYRNTNTTRKRRKKLMATLNKIVRGDKTIIAYARESELREKDVTNRKEKVGPGEVISKAALELHLPSNDGATLNRVSGVKAPPPEVSSEISTNGPCNCRQVDSTLTTLLTYSCIRPDLKPMWEKWIWALKSIVARSGGTTVDSSDSGLETEIQIDANPNQQQTHRILNCEANQDIVSIIDKLRTCEHPSLAQNFMLQLCVYAEMSSDYKREITEIGGIRIAEATHQDFSYDVGVRDAHEELKTILSRRH